MAEVESLTKALEGAAVEKQGFSEALALKRQRVGTLERQVASLLGKMAAAREEVNMCITTSDLRSKPVFYCVAVRSLFDHFAFRWQI